MFKLINCLLYEYSLKISIISIYINVVWQMVLLSIKQVLAWQFSKIMNIYIFRRYGTKAKSNEWKSFCVWYFMLDSSRVTMVQLANPSEWGKMNSPNSEKWKKSSFDFGLELGLSFMDHGPLGKEEADHWVESARALGSVHFDGGQEVHENSCRQVCSKGRRNDQLPQKGGGEATTLRLFWDL